MKNEYAANLKIHEIFVVISHFILRLKASYIPNEGATRGTKNPGQDNIQVVNLRRQTHSFSPSGR